MKNPMCFAVGFVAGMFVTTTTVLVAEPLQIIDVLNLF
jgi:hypothetical protein